MYKLHYSTHPSLSSLFLCEIVPLLALIAIIKRRRSKGFKILLLFSMNCWIFLLFSSRHEWDDRECYIFSLLFYLQWWVLILDFFVLKLRTFALCDCNEFEWVCVWFRSVSFVSKCKELSKNNLHFIIIKHLVIICLKNFLFLFSFKYFLPYFSRDILTGESIIGGLIKIQINI